MIDVLVIVLMLCGSPQGVITESESNIHWYAWEASLPAKLEEMHPEDEYTPRFAKIHLDNILPGSCT